MFDISRLNFRRSPVTISLLVVIVALELYCNLNDEVRNTLYNRWFGIWWQIWTWELWRPFTSCLLHGDLIHMAFNAFWLAVFGPVLEQRFGSLRTLGLIVLLGYVSSLGDYILDGYLHDPPHGAVGFSGIGYGLFGLILIGRRYVPQWWDVCNDQTVIVFIGWFFLCVIMTKLEMMPVANVAHGAGFLFGMLYGQVIFDKPRRNLWLALAVPLTAIVLATMVACPGHSHYDMVQKYLNNV